MKFTRVMLLAVAALLAAAAVGNGTAGADDDKERKQSDRAPTQRAPAPQGSISSLLACNGPAVAFESGIPADWSVSDNAGNGVVWTTVVASGEPGNYTGGGGEAASVSSDKAGTVEFDTALSTPVINLTGFTSVTLNYVANYQNFVNSDFLDLQISRNFGDTWITLLSWNEDHGAFRGVLGVPVSVNLSSFAGLSSAQLRWHYYDPNSGDWDYYAQVDDVSLSCAGAIAPVALTCNSGPTNFNSGIPANWFVYDFAGEGVYWKNVAGSGETGNFTGGGGDAASVSSDKFGTAEFDTALRSPQFDLTGYKNVLLRFDANYQNFAAQDFLNVGIGGSFTKGYNTLLNWNEDHGTFRNTPGENTTVDLSAYAGLSGVYVRWWYYDPGVGDFDWYAQVDNVELICSSTEKWGDVDCSGAVNSVDALNVLRRSSGLSVSQTEPCPDIGTIVNAGFITIRPMGDVDCGNAVNSVDALKILRFGSGLSVGQALPCPMIGVGVEMFY